MTSTEVWTLGSAVCLFSWISQRPLTPWTTPSCMLERLEAVAGIRGAALAWLRSYLHDRTQSVIINGVQSTTVDLSIGVPQGLVLGPLLFLVYVIPLRSVIGHHPGVRHHGYMPMTTSCTPSLTYEMWTAIGMGCNGWRCGWRR